MRRIVPMLASCSGQPYRIRGPGLRTSVHGPTRRTTAVASAVLAAALVAVVGCSPSADGPAPQAASSSSNPDALPTPEGTVPDSIEDINSTKDMTGVVTTYSNDANPYIKLIPYVCPFLPDSLTREKLGMVDKQTGFGGQHTLLQICNMGSATGPNYEQLGITVTVQATSFSDATSTASINKIAEDVPVWKNVTGTVYKNSIDDTDEEKVCNIVWGTFYGSAVVSIFVSKGYVADACQKAPEVARMVAPFLPSTPSEMRPTEK
ncbi:hypothetical protein [Williamsia sp.]|uniref:hypothetical protein n=1 Tax=Williamsia sp. TaxID=1872085 RepID=UPI001A24528E|nr:hypothetical protein [Williamsia sp.]MBJ7291144.1 hypothetical protein [Williamsia sp.]